jgi:hypothetical protein
MANEISSRLKSLLSGAVGLPEETKELVEILETAKSNDNNNAPFVSGSGNIGYFPVFSGDGGDIADNGIGLQSPEGSFSLMGQDDTSWLSIGRYETEGNFARPFQIYAKQKFQVGPTEPDQAPEFTLTSNSNSPVLNIKTSQDDSGTGVWRFTKARGGVNETSVQNGDDLFVIESKARYGAGIVTSGQIDLKASGTIAFNTVPSTMNFSTSDGAGVRANRLSLTHDYQAKFQTVDVVVSTVGKGLKIKEGLNARMGIATLVAGEVTVPNTSITASTRIFLTCQDPNGGTVGQLYVSARTASTSFVISSTSITDTSIVAYELIEPA